MALFSLFTGLVLASKRAWTESLILVFTQLPLLLLFHRHVPCLLPPRIGQLTPRSPPCPCPASCPSA